MKLPKIRRYRQNSGVAAIIIIILVALMFFAVLWAAFNFAVLQFQTIQTTYFGGGVFQTDATTFINLWWVWSPIIMILVPLILWGFQQSQRRAPGYDV